MYVATTMSKVLNKEQLLQIENLRAAGRPIREIAKQVGCSPNTVLKHVHDPNFKVDISGSRKRLKELHAQEAVRTAEKTYRMADRALVKGKAFELKAATGALKDLDQLSAVAAGEDKQAGVPSAPPTAIDLKVLIQQILGNIPLGA